MPTSTNPLFINLPWIEKYRPGKTSNVKVNKCIKFQIDQMIRRKDISNIILEGPPGVGKTTSIRCIARELYGRYYRYMVLELNAANDRGIKIQESIEHFRKSYVHIKKEDIGIIPSFKLVILDEADNMTDKAKHIISAFIKNCVNDLRFAFTCNIKDNIIASIQSGCHIIKYPPLDPEIIIGRLSEICVFEKIITPDTKRKKLKHIDSGIRSITDICMGDMRNAINILQLTYNRYSEITTDYVFNITDKPHPEKSKEIILLCCDKKLGPAIENTLNMTKGGYSGTDILIGLRLVLRMDICQHISEHIKIEFWRCISYALYNISKGLDTSVLQITACIAEMCGIAS